MDIGGQTFVDVELVNPGKLLLEAGLNIFVEVTFDEANRMVRERRAEYQQRLEGLARKREDVVAYLRQIEDVLGQLSSEPV